MMAYQRAQIVPQEVQISPNTSSEKRTREKTTTHKWYLNYNAKLIPPQSQKFINNDKFEIVTHGKYFSPTLHKLRKHSPTQRRSKSAKMRSGPILKQSAASPYHFKPHLPGASGASIIPEDKELLPREVQIHESDRKMLSKCLETNTDKKGNEK